MYQENPEKGSRHQEQQDSKFFDYKWFGELTLNCLHEGACMENVSYPLKCRSRNPRPLSISNYPLPLSPDGLYLAV